jgi:drug/metabolite transporter (DMT)-like permease
MCTGRIYGAIRGLVVADWSVTDTAITPQASRLGLSAATTAILAWSAGNIMVREVPMSGLQIAFWRILLAAVVYTVAVYLSGRRLTWDHIRRTIPTGVVIGLEIAVFFVAIKSTTVANATVIGSLVPLLLMGVASRRFGEAVTRFLLGAAVVSLGGVALVMYGSSSGSTWSLRGDLLAVVALVLFAAYFALAKAAREDVPALEFQAALWIAGSVVLFPVAVIDARGIDVPTAGNWLWLAALLLVPGTGHLLMNWAHPHVKLTVSSMLTLGVPVLTTIGGAVFLDEPVDVLQVAGIAVVLGALAELIRREARLEKID